MVTREIREHQVPMDRPEPRENLDYQDPKENQAVQERRVFLD